MTKSLVMSDGPRAIVIVQHSPRQMDKDAAREFLATNHRGILLTYRSDGMPQMSPIIAGVDADGYVTVSSRETAYKVKNLLRNPSASLCMFTDGFYGGWVQVDGTAEIVTLPEAMEPLVDYYRRPFRGASRLAGLPGCDAPGAAGHHPDPHRPGRADEVRISARRVGPAYPAGRDFGCLAWAALRVAPPPAASCPRQRSRGTAGLPEPSVSVVG